MSKYAPLKDRLSSTKRDRWVASFDDIERILGFRLPESARKHPAWWANQSTPGHSQCAGWLEVGWRTADLNLSRQQVTFVKFNKSRQEAPAYKPSRAGLNWADVLDEPEGPIQLQVKFNWCRLGSLELDTKNMIVFPRTPIGPAVYRFKLSSRSEHAYYFGETEEVSRRFQHYRTPGRTQRTNQWLNLRMRECLSDGGSVGINVLCDGQFIFNDGHRETDLSCKFTRRLLENVVIVMEKRSGLIVLNK